MTIHKQDLYKREADFDGSKGPEYAILLDELEEFLHGDGLSDLYALDMYAGDGSFRTIDLIKRVGMFEGWDISVAKIERLKQQFPWIKVKVGRATSLAEEAIDNNEYFDLISLDAPIKCYGAGFCEHFEILPYVTSLLNTPGALLMNVATKAVHGDVEHMKRREEYYGRPAEGLTMDWLVDFYTKKFCCGVKPMEVIHHRVEPHCYMGGYNFALFVLEDLCLDR